jgi:hypothetical protein
VAGVLVWFFVRSKFGEGLRALWVIIDASINLVLRSAHVILRRACPASGARKDDHKRDRASGHPSRRRFAPPQDEVCGFKLHRPIRLASWNRSTSARRIRAVRIWPALFPHWMHPYGL